MVVVATAVRPSEMSDLNPITAFRKWYESQPFEIQGDIAAWVLTFHPTTVDQKPMRAVIEARLVFAEWLDAAKGDSEYRTVGKVLHIRSVMEFFCVQRYGDAHEWEQNREQNEDLVVEFDEIGSDLAKTVADGINRLSERERLWRATVNSWRTFANTSISFEVLEAWLEQKNFR